MECVCPIVDRPTEVDETGCRQDSWSLVQCRETGFVFLPNPPEYSQLESEYAWEKTLEVEKLRRQQQEPIFSHISSLAKRARLKVFSSRNKIAAIASSIASQKPQWQPLNLLDIGCGGGSLMVVIHQQLSRRGRQVIPNGIEVSEQLAEMASSRIADLGGKILFANALAGAEQLPSHSIHIATMSSFLEHECRPLRLLQQLHRALADDGVIILKVPNYACWNRRIRQRKWCGYRFPDHVNYFTPATLCRLASEAGYVVLRQSFMDRFPFSDNMYAVLGKVQP